MKSEEILTNILDNNNVIPISRQDRDKFLF